MNLQGGGEEREHELKTKIPAWSKRKKEVMRSVEKSYKMGLKYKGQK